MIGIRVNNRLLLLPAGFELSMEVVNQSFSEQLIEGSYSFPIELDRCPENDEVLGMTGDFNLDNENYQFAAMIERKGNKWRPARLIIERIGSEKISGFLRTGIQAMEIIDKKLNELDYGGIITVGTGSTALIDYAKDLMDNGDWEDGFQFPMIKNPDFYGDKNPDFAGYINHYDTTTNEYLLNGPNAPDPSNINCMVPQLYELWLLKKVFENAGYTIDHSQGEFFELGWKKKMLYNNYALDFFGDPHYRLQASWNAATASAGDEVYTAGTHRLITNDDSTGTNYDPDNCYNAATREYTVVVAGRHQLFADFSFYPNLGSNIFCYVKLTWKLDALVLHQEQIPIQNYSTRLYSLTCAVTPTLLAGDIGKKLTCDVTLLTPGVGSTAEIIMNGARINIDALDNSSVNIYSTQIDVRNHVPDMTVNEYLNAVKESWGINFDVDEGLKKVTFYPTKAKFNTGEYREFSKHSSPKHEGYINTERIKLIGYQWPTDDGLVEGNFKGYNKGQDRGRFNGPADFPSDLYAGDTMVDDNSNRRYITTVTPTGTVEINYLRDDYDDYLIDSSATVEKRIAICPIFMELDTDKDIYLPTIKNQGSSNPFGLGINPVTPRSMYWVPDEAYVTYPFASSQKRFNGGNLTVCGSRFYSTLSGVAKEALAEHIDLIGVKNSKFVYEIEAVIDISDIDEFFTYEGIQQQNRIRGMDFLIRKVSFTLNDKEKDVAKFTYMKIQ